MTAERPVWVWRRMHMSMPDMISRAAGKAAALVQDIGSLDLEAPTTCSEFDQRALANHLTGFLPYSANAARKGPAMEGNAPDFAGDPAWAANFAAMAKDTAAAWSESGALDGETAFGSGMMPAENAAGITLMELTIHAWDLARSTGRSFSTDEDIAETVAAIVSGFVGGGPSDFFAAPVAAGDDASSLERAVATSGRDPDQTV